MTNILANFTVDFDFVAQNSTGSIALLVPEPSSLTLLSLLAIGIVRRRKPRNPCMPDAAGAGSSASRPRRYLLRDS
jgi:hypothetical protein